MSEANTMTVGSTWAKKKNPSEPSAAGPNPRLPKMNDDPTSTAARNLTNSPETHANAAAGHPRGANASARSSPRRMRTANTSWRPSPNPTVRQFTRRRSDDSASAIARMTARPRRPRPIETRSMRRRGGPAT